VGHRLDGIVSGSNVPRLFQLAMQRRVNAVRQKLSRGVASLAGFYQGRIDTQRDSVLFVGEAEFEAPPLGTVGCDFQVKPPFVRQSVWYGTGLGVLADDVGQRHGATPLVA
jgi:hypothetical protein